MPSLEGHDTNPVIFMELHRHSLGESYHSHRKSQERYPVVCVIINGCLPDMNEAPNKNVDLRYAVRIHYKFHKPATGVSNRCYPMHRAYVGK